MCLISDNLTNWQLLDFVLVLLEWFLYFNYFISFIHYSNWERRNLESDNLPKRIFMETFVYGPICHIRGLLSGLKQSLTIESSLEMMKNNFYFMLKAPFIHGAFTFLSWLFGYVVGATLWGAMVDFGVCGVRGCAADDCGMVFWDVVWEIFFFVGHALGLLGSSVSVLRGIIIGAGGVFGLGGSRIGSLKSFGNSWGTLHTAVYY